MTIRDGRPVNDHIPGRKKVGNYLFNRLPRLPRPASGQDKQVLDDCSRLFAGLRMFAAYSRKGLPEGSLSIRSSEYPETTPRTLLRLWATPPANFPSAPIFSDRWRCSDIAVFPPRPLAFGDISEISDQAVNLTVCIEFREVYPSKNSASPASEINEVSK